jgi:hypothetical protein
LQDFFATLAWPITKGKLRMSADVAQQSQKTGRARQALN